MIHNEFLSYITFFLLFTDTSMESSSHVSKCVPIIILCFSIGLRADAVTSSLESASVSMDSGFRTTATAYNIENSLSVGILCQYCSLLQVQLQLLAIVQEPSQSFHMLTPASLNSTN